jgi:hypothetical protein
LVDSQPTNYKITKSQKNFENYKIQKNLFTFIEERLQVRQFGKFLRGKNVRRE